MLYFQFFFARTATIWNKCQVYIYERTNKVYRVYNFANSKKDARSLTENEEK